MKPTSNYLKTYFTFSKTERNGIIFLLAIIFALIIFIQVYPKVQPHKSKYDFTTLQREVDSLYVKNSIIEPVNKFQKEITLVSQSAPQKLTIEINSSDSANLTKLPGIGPVFASRIIKYRNLLGGYVHLGQLKEVYGLKEENIIKASPHLKVNKNLLVGISADTASFRALARHPYIGKDRAWKIINLRKNIQPISTEDLKNTAIFDSTQWQRVEPYFIFKKVTSSNN